MSEFRAGTTPGFHVDDESAETNVLWSGRHGQTFAATQKTVVAAANTDPANTPTTTLLGGHVLALADASGKAYLYDPDANDGRQVAVGILEHTQDMLQGGVATDRFTQMLVQGLVKEADLHGLDRRAQRQLAARFVFDRNLDVGPGELMHPRGVYRFAANEVLTRQHDGLLLLATAAVTFTLPAKENGLAFRFLQTADANLVIQGSADIVARGNASASSLTFSTGSQKIGSHVLVECVYVGTNTLKWIVSNLGDTVMTVA